MRIIAASAVLVIAGSGAALACPTIGQASGTINATPDQFGSVQSYSVTAGGENSLQDCGLGLLGYGSFRSAPDLSLTLQQVVGRELDLRVNASCDAAMLVNTADGQWLFDDDGNGNLDPAMRITAAGQLDGQVDIWIGTFDGAGCPATLQVQGFGAGGTPLAPSGGVGLPPVAAPVPVPAPAPVPVPVICPNPALVGPSLTLTGQQLLAPQAYVAQVGGTHDVALCPGLNAFGMADESPSFTLNLSQMTGMQFVAEVNSGCDPTLLLRDAFGQWHFNDDGPNGVQPRLDVAGQSLNGRVDIWVGSWSGEACSGTISFSASQAAVPAPQPVPVPVPVPTPAPAPQQVAGCPDPNATGPQIATTGAELYSPDTYFVSVGGSTDVTNCGLPIFATGNFEATPSYSFFVTEMQEHDRIEIEGTSECDMVLLVRTPTGQWLFDDDSNGNLDPLINVTGVRGIEGRLDVWVGSYSGQTCSGSIEVETWIN